MNRLTKYTIWIIKHSILINILCPPNSWTRKLFEIIYLKSKKYVFLYRNKGWWKKYRSKRKLLKNLNSGQLISRQENFIQKVTDHIEIKRKDSRKKNAVFLQCGSGLVSPERFFDQSNCNWDLIINHYDSTYISSFDCFVEISYSQYPGATKFLAYYLLSREYPDLIEKYDYVCFMDDDVNISVESINNLFDFGKDLNLNCFQASLTSDSNAEWPILKENTNFYPNNLRFVNAVEVMAPVYSRNIIKKTIPYFRRSISTWGIDLIVGHVCNSFFYDSPVVCTNILIEHRKKSNQDDGAFYKMLKGLGIDPRKEMNLLLLLFGLNDARIYALNYSNHITGKLKIEVV